jgi:type IV pilus assembly protein PilQ
MDMRNLRGAKWTLTAMMVLVLGLTTAWAGSAGLWDLRVHETEGSSPWVELAADGEFAWEAFALENPNRLVIDMSDTVSRLERSLWEIEAGGVVQVRSAQYQSEPDPVTRIVFDLDTSVAYSIKRTTEGLAVRFGEAPADSAPAEEAVSVNTENPIEPVTEPSTLAEATPSPVTDDFRQETDGTWNWPPEAPQDAVMEAAKAETSRALPESALDSLLATPSFAAPEPEPQTGRGVMPESFSTRRLADSELVYTGRRISLNFVDADIKQVFRLFHEISGINFVLDPGVSGRVTIAVDQVPWDQTLDLILKNNGLDKVIENNVIRIASTAKLANEATNRKSLQEAKELEVEPITITRQLSYAKAKDLEQVFQNRRQESMLSVRGSIIVDERTNTVIFRDIPARIAMIEQLLDTLDAQTPQVMIEARIVETSRDFVQDLGVTWGLGAIADDSRGTGTGLDFPANASVRYGLNLPGAGAASNLAFSFGNILDSFTLDLALNTLETEGEGRILSSPKIATQNNELATIEQGVRIPVVNTTATEINVEFVSASLRLEVTPQITAEGTVILDVIVENNSPDFSNTVGDVPPINTQRAQTKLEVKDGGTTVIGGIFTVSEGRSEVGVPWFRKLPLFGWLFKTQNITQKNRELLIFITPKILKFG